MLILENKEFYKVKDVIKGFELLQKSLPKDLESLNF